MKVYSQDENVVARRIADEVILVPIRQDVADLQCIYTLNEAGARIWELVDGLRSVEEIGQVICKEFDVTQERAQRDTEEFLQRLDEAGIVLRIKEAGIQVKVVKEEDDGN